MSVGDMPWTCPECATLHISWGLNADGHMFCADCDYVDPDLHPEAQIYLSSVTEECDHQWDTSLPPQCMKCSEWAYESPGQARLTKAEFDANDFLPELTASDVGAFIQVLTAFVMMGTTRVEIHPVRWPIILRGLILHKAYDVSQLRYVGGIEDFDHAVMEIEFATKTGKVGCLLMMRPNAPPFHTDETMEQHERLETQGAFYDVPEEPKLVDVADKKIWMPN